MHRFFLTGIIFAVTALAAAETLPLEQPMTAGICGYRRMWDQPVMTGPEGLRVLVEPLDKDYAIKDRGGVAPWVTPTLTTACETGAWYGNLCLPGITAYLGLAENALARLADAAGDPARSAAAMRRHMWDEEAGTFLAVHHETLAKVRVPTIGSWIPLHAGIPTAAQAQRMAAVLATPEWLTPLPVPTVSRRDPHWNDGKLNNPGGNFWRGDVWPATNYQIADGLARAGFHELASEIATRTIRNAMRQGLSEHYDCDTGAALGVTFLGMTATVFTMALDGLAPEFQAKVNPQKSSHKRVLRKTRH